MKEDLLQYIWNFKLFKNTNFVTTEGDAINIINYGIWNKNQGPDFSLAKIKVGNTVFFGNIELHINASDWHHHQHDGNADYETIILHVVFNYDSDVKILSQKNIPTLELKNYIDPNVIKQYENLSHATDFIPCETVIKPSHIPLFFSENIVLEKLNKKADAIEADLQKNLNNYEEVLFHQLAYAFGLKVNAELFLQLAEIIDYKWITKIRQNKTQLEALFFGLCNWLDSTTEDHEIKLWQREFEFLKSKFAISEVRISPKYSKLRPPNFPNLRLSQLADLIHSEPHLFSKIKNANTLTDLKLILNPIKASSYWDNHYNFGVTSEKVYSKTLSADFIDLLLLNVILPIKYSFERYENEETEDSIMSYYKDLKSEKNTIIDKWKSLDIPITTALDSQAFLYQYKTNCLAKNCLNCRIGFQILKNGEQH